MKSAWDKIEVKANPADTGTFQANNIVVNLADSPLSASDVAQYVARNPVPGLRNLILIKNGNVTTVSMGW